MATGDRYTGNPLDPAGTFTFSDGQSIPATLEDAFGGSFRQIGTTIRSTVTGRIVTNVSTAGPFSVVELEGGRIGVNSTQSPAEINHYQGPDDMLTIGGNVDVSLPDGSQVTVNIDPVHVNRIGQQTVMRLDADKNWQPLNAKVQGNSQAALRQWVRNVFDIDMGNSFRFATPEETASHSLGYALSRGNRSLITQLADSGLIGDEGGEDDGSNALRYLVRQLSLEDLTITRSFILSPGA